MRFPGHACCVCFHFYFFVNASRGTQDKKLQNYEVLRKLLPHLGCRTRQDACVYTGCRTRGLGVGAGGVGAGSAHATDAILTTSWPILWFCLQYILHKNMAHETFHIHAVTHLARDAVTADGNAASNKLSNTKKTRQWCTRYAYALQRTISKPSHRNKSAPGSNNTLHKGRFQKRRRRGLVDEMYIETCLIGTVASANARALFLSMVGYVACRSYQR